jgi:hypothetical protein
MKAWERHWMQLREITKFCAGTRLLSPRMREGIPFKEDFKLFVWLQQRQQYQIYNKALRTVLPP